MRTYPRSNGFFWTILFLVGTLSLRLVLVGTSSRTAVGTIYDAILPWSQNGDGVSACLLVMDDNHFLVEWIAYHYHVWNLKRLVVAVDPKSTTSPQEILGRWKDTIEITAWTSDGDYASPDEFKAAEKIVAQTFKEKTPSLVEHRARQRLFYTKCLRHVKEEHESSWSYFKPAWTMLVDVDEFVRVNYQALNRWVTMDTKKSGATKLDEITFVPIRTSGSAASILQSFVALPSSTSRIKKKKRNAVGLPPVLPVHPAAPASVCVHHRGRCPSN